MKNEKEKMEIETNGNDICEQFDLRYDSRFRYWLKIVDDIDLNQSGGYAISGNFYGFKKSILIKNNQFVIIGTELGSRKSHNYEYSLLQNQNSKLVKIDIDIEAFKDILEYDVYVKARKNELYAIAVQIWYLQNQEP